jgi:riboflavin synthase alpha subunit
MAKWFHIVARSDCWSSIICHSDQGRIIHLHVTLGTADGQVIDGHLVDGEIYTTVELVPAVGPRQSVWAASPASRHVASLPLTSVCVQHIEFKIQKVLSACMTDASSRGATMLSGRRQELRVGLPSMPRHHVRE